MEKWENQKYNFSTVSDFSFDEFASEEKKGRCKTLLSRIFLQKKKKKKKNREINWKKWFEVGFTEKFLNVSDATFIGVDFTK